MHINCDPGSPSMCPDCESLYHLSQAETARRAGYQARYRARQRAKRGGPFLRVRYEWSRFVVRGGKQ